MTGVEILAANEVAVSFGVDWISFFIMFGGIVILSLLLGIIWFVNTNKFYTFIIILLIGLVIGLLFGVVAGDGDRIPTEYETQYKVTISDEVSMNDFLERYEIIDQEGKIYTVRERDGVEDGK